MSDQPGNFTHFDSGETVQPIPTRRATDGHHHSNLEIIAHKTSRMAAELSELKEEMHKSIDRIERAMTYNHATMTEAVQRAAKAAIQAEEMAKANLSTAMASAFPEGDIEGHKRHHQALIKKAEESAEFWASMRKEVGKWGLISVIGFLAIAAWNSFLQGPHK